MATRPELTPEESFYMFAFNVLSSAGYQDISAFCRDYGLTIDERSDLLEVIRELRGHRSRNDADS